MNPIPKDLVVVAQSHTQGAVTDEVHLASRYRFLEQHARVSSPWRAWLSAGPVLAGAALVVLVALGATLAFRDAPIVKDNVAISTEPVTAAAQPGSGDARRSTPIPNVEEVIAKLRPALRRCYQEGLAVDPKMQGKAMIEVTVAASGEVKSTRVLSNDGLSTSVAECLAYVMRRAQFAASSGESTLTVPISFVVN